MKHEILGKERLGILQYLERRMWLFMALKSYFELYVNVVGGRRMSRIENVPNITQSSE